MIGNYLVPQTLIEVDICDLKLHETYEKYYGSDVELSNVFLKSLDKLGFIETPLINKDNMVLSGWRRIKGWEQIGNKKVFVFKLEPDDIHKEVVESLEEEIIVMANDFKEKSELARAKEVQFLFDLYKERVGRPSNDKDASINVDNPFMRIIIKPEDGDKSLKGKKTSQIVHEITGINEKWILFLKKLDLADSDNLDLLKSVENKTATKKSAIELYEKKKAQEGSIEGTSIGVRKTIDTNEDFNYDNYFKLHCRSSVDLSIIPNKSVDCIICSPPYGNIRTYSNLNEDLGNFDPNSPSLSFAKYRLIFDELFLKCKDTGNFYLNVGDFHYNGKLFDYPEKIKNVAIEAGFSLVNTIIYRKTNPKPCGGTRTNPPSYEFIFHLVKTQEYKFNAFRIKTKNGKLRIESVPLHHRTATKNFNSDTVYSEDKVLPNYWDDQTLIEGSVGTLNLFKKYEVDTNLSHCAPFPPLIPMICIQQGSDPGDTILDPFNGSGMTGKFAIEFGRKYIGIDINQNYIDASEQVLRKVTDDVTAGLF